MPQRIKSIGLLICLCLLISNYCFAEDYQQSEKSSTTTAIPEAELEDKLAELELLFEKSELDSAYALGRQIAVSAKTYKRIQLKVQAVYQLARIKNRQNKFEKSDTLVNAALGACADDSLSFNMILLSYNNMMRIGDFEEAKSRLDQAKQHMTDTLGVQMVRYRYSLADYYNHAVNDHKKVLDLLLLAKKEAPKDIPYDVLFNINYQLGALYNSIAVYDQALIVGKENEQLAIENEDPYYQLFGIYTQLASHIELKNHKQIKELVNRCINIKNEHNVSTVFEYLYFNQGRSYLQQEKLDSALHYFDLGEKVSLERNSKVDLSDNLLGKSKVYFKRGQFALAKKYLKDSRDAHDGEVDGMEEMYWKLAAIDGDYRVAYQGALASLEKINNENETENSYEIISALLTDKFNIEKEQQELNRQATAKRSRLVTIQGLATGIIFALSLLAAFLITNRKKLEKLNRSLVKRNEALTNFSYISSHDLKEPVRNIVSFSELLEESLSKSSTHAKELEFASIIKNSSNTLLEIVKSLKIFSETAFDDEIQLEEFDIGDVFKDLERNMHQAITQKNGKVTFTNDEKISTFTFSKPMLYLLLQNLIQNALKYNDSQKPMVNVELGTKKKEYIFKVSDNGKGIAPEKIDYVFKPFKTLQNKSLSQSSGLGLSICKNILEKFGGKIWVDSVLDKGSTFYFSLPKNKLHV